MFGKNDSREFINECIQSYLESHASEIKKIIMAVPDSSSVSYNNACKEAWQDGSSSKKELREELEQSLKERDKLQDALNRKQKFNDELATANRELEQDNRSLHNQIERDREEYNTAYNRVIEEKKRLQAEVEDLKERLEKELQAKEDLSVKLTEYRDKYMNLETVYDGYCSLDADIREIELQRICGVADSPVGLLAALSQRDNLDNLWEYIAYGINDNKFTSYEEGCLQNLFNFSFELVNASQGHTLYRRIECALGEEYDSSYMKKISNSRQQGEVEEVKLLGYEDLDGDIIKKCLVKLA